MTHCDRLLAALADGEWHDHHELYQFRMVVHSRVADLRRKGHTVEQRRDGDLYMYRLLPGGVLDGTDGETSSIVSRHVGPVERAPADGNSAAYPPPGGGEGALEQLALEVAA